MKEFDIEYDEKKFNHESNFKRYAVFFPHEHNEGYLEDIVGTQIPNEDDEELMLQKWFGKFKRFDPDADNLKNQKSKAPKVKKEVIPKPPIV